MAFIAVIALVAIALWYGLTRWIAGMLAADEDPPGRRLGATALAGLLAAAAVVAIASGLVAWLRHGMRF